MPRVVTTSLLSATVVTLVVACGGADEAPGESSGEDAAAAAEQTEADTKELTATLVDPEGTEVGTVTFGEAEEGTEVSVDVAGLPPGFHGFHVHAIGVCEPDSANPSDPSMTGDFLSAGGHIGAGESDHGEHPGDLPTLYVAESGTGSLTAVTDALALADLTDDDGSAVMVHASRDNYANIPERYAPGGPDEMTLNTGDAGGRIACGPVEDSGQG
jgi:superoxide dismutase, Cu-Zn family